MFTITIDGTQYAEEAFSEEDNAALVSLQNDLAIAKATHNAYAVAGKDLLPKAAVPKAKAKKVK